MISGSASGSFSAVGLRGRRKHCFSTLQSPRRLVTRLGACGLLAAFLALGLPAAAGAAIQFGPTKGGPKTSFKLQFTAPLSERGTADDPLDFYVVKVSGPPGCSEASEYTTDNVTAGQLVTLRVDPSDIKPFGEARQWCVGRYSGTVSFCYCDPDDPSTPPDVPVGSFSFTIRGPSNYAGTTKQRKSIRFTLSATGTRITRLNSTIRFTCRAGGRSRSFSSPVRQESRDKITLRNGTFKVRESETAEGLRASFELTGRLANGTFQGKLRLRASGRGVRCDSGSVSWSAR